MHGSTIRLPCRMPRTKSVLQGIILVLVMIIVYQVLDLNNRDCVDRKRVDPNHHGLPWDMPLDVDKRALIDKDSNEPEANAIRNKVVANPPVAAEPEKKGVPEQKPKPIKTSPIKKGGKTLKKPVRPNCFKQVQIWSTEYTLWNQGEVLCPGLPCGIRQYTSTSYKTLQKSDAVLLWHETLWDWDELHKSRPEGQKWILTTQESPINTRRSVIPPPKYYKNSYNYIMTYHVDDTDFYASFGRYDTTKPSVPANDTRNWADKKDKVVAWAARNCNNSYIKWKRTEFVRGLSEMISVDMYGRCGDKSCPINEKVCSDTLRKHKFYLSLENSNCRHYISEKFWKMAFEYDLVPVVYGPPREDYEKVAPPKSFIHVDDFNSLKELADYLDLLDMNDDKYNEYFAWKKKGSVHVTRGDWLYQPQQMCQVVERMLEDEKAMAAGNYNPPEMPDWEQFWWGSCKAIGDFPIVMN